MRVCSQTATEASFLPNGDWTYVGGLRRRMGGNHDGGSSRWGRAVEDGYRGGLDGDNFLPLSFIALHNIVPRGPEYVKYAYRKASGITRWRRGVPVPHLSLRAGEVEGCEISK